MKYGLICKKFVLISNVSGCLNENYLNLVNPKEGVTKAGYLNSARDFPPIDVNFNVKIKGYVVPYFYPKAM